MSDGENTRLVISSILAGAMGYILHVLKARGDKQARKDAAENSRKARLRDFRGVISGFRSWAELEALGHLGTNLYGNVIRFRGETGSIRDDVPEANRARFDEAVKVVSEMQIGEVVEHKILNTNQGSAEVDEIGRKRLLAAIDAVSKTLE